MLKKTIQAALAYLGLVLIDLLVLTATFFSLYLYRITKEINVVFYWRDALNPDYIAGLPLFDPYLKMYLLLIVVAIGFLVHYKTYVWDKKVSLLEQFHKVFLAVTYTVVLAMGTTFIFKIPFFSRFVFFAFWSLAVLLLVLCRIIYGIVLSGLLARGYLTKRLLVVGAGKLGKLVAEEINGKQDLGYRIIGITDTDPAKAGLELAGSKVIGDHSLINALVQENKVDEILITIPSEREVIKGIIARARRYNVQIRIIPEMSDLYLSSVEVGQLGPIPYMRIIKNPMRGWPMLVKRLMDIVLSGITLLVLSPLLMLTALAIKLSSPGPLLFVQKRVGKNGKVFDFYKFRSMVTNAEKLRLNLAAANEADGPVFKIRDDPRVTGVGRFIRRFSIDETPQLYNVLKGEMSLVGPRPPLVEEVDSYGDWEWRRLEVTPGLTCLWQVSGRSNLPFHKWMELDVYYIENWSLWLDLRIILQTVPAVLKGNGAY